MDSEKLKQCIGNNIAVLRRQSGMTQAELAEKLNYTDKAVSKWERGESIPDMTVLVQLADMFAVSLDELAGRSFTEAAAQQGKQQTRKARKGVIQTLVSLLVWFVAMLVYVVLSSLDIGKSWVGFIYAVPANAIVLLSLRSAWRKYNGNFLLVSAIVWGALVSLHVTLLVFTGVNVWRLFLLGILGQAAVCLWFRMFHTVKEDSNG